jgi:hypothetical protein
MHVFLEIFIHLVFKNYEHIVQSRAIALRYKNIKLLTDLLVSTTFTETKTSARNSCNYQERMLNKIGKVYSEYPMEYRNISKVFFPSTP